MRSRFGVLSRKGEAAQKGNASNAEACPMKVTAWAGMEVCVLKGDESRSEASTMKLAWPME